MILIFCIFIIGLSGLIAQVVILRELLVSFYGNELTIGLILANWVAAEALGVYIFGRLADKLKKSLSLFISLNLIYCLIFPFVVYLSRIFKYLLGIPFAEAVSLPVIFLVSFAINLPLAALHGALFSSGAKVYSTKCPDNPLGKIYLWETLGTIFGGLILAFIFVTTLNSFQIAFITISLNLLVMIFFIGSIRLRKLLLILGMLLFAIYYKPQTDFLQKSSLRLQWPGQDLLENHNSNYGNIVVTKKEEQYTLFYNGTPLIIAPFPDKQFVEDFINFPLLINESPKSILIAGSGFGGLINEALKYPIRRLDYVEIDPWIVKLFRKHPTKLVETELSDKRVNIAMTDPRLYLSRNKIAYDVIFIGFSDQSDLSLNRLFTLEFFELANRSLQKGGMLALWLPGSLTYISPELADLNNSIINSLKTAFKYVRVIPGDYNILIASDSEAVINPDHNKITGRISSYGITTEMFLPEYLKYRLDSKWVSWLEGKLEAASSDINQDLRPIAVFDSLRITNNKFSPKFGYFFDYLKYARIEGLILIVGLITLLLGLLVNLGGKNRLPVAYAIFSTGFFGMLANLLIIFTYQVYLGSLYQKISLLMAVFMSGIAFGSLILFPHLDRIARPRLLLFKIELLILFTLVVLGYVLDFLNIKLSHLGFIFYLSLFICGFLMGFEFPLSGKIYSQDRLGIGRISGVLYACDLMGGWLAGMMVGVFLLPVFGLFKTFMLAATLKLSSLILLGTPSKSKLRVSP